MKGWLRLFLFLLLAAAGCGPGKKPAGSGQITLSIYPLYDIAATLQGGENGLVCAVPPGANPHTFEPTPSVAARLARTTLFIGITPELDGWIGRYLPGESRRVFLLDTLRAGRNQNLENPHIWLSLTLARDMAKIMARQISAADPGKNETIKKNLAGLIASIDSLDHDLTMAFKDLPEKRFIQYHPAWNYLALDYNLEIVGTLATGHGDEPSVKEFAALIKKAQAGGIRTVVTGLDQENAALSSLTRELGGRLVVLDSIGDPDDPKRSGYLKLMRYNSLLLARALSQSARERLP